MGLRDWRSWACGFEWERGLGNAGFLRCFENECLFD